MNPGYDFHPEAENDFTDIWDFIAADSADAADRVTDEIVARLEGLVKFPQEPFVLRTPEGILIEGKIDLAYRCTDGWTLVDYKTGQVRNSQYERQVRWYAMALQASSGLPVRSVLLEIG